MSFVAKLAEETRRAVQDDIYRSNAVSEGEVFWVFEDSDTDYTRMVKRHPENVFNTYTDAVGAVTSNRNDIIFVNAHSSHTIGTTGLAMTKSRVHTIGLDGGNRLVQQGAKIGSSSTDTTAYVLKNTGTRNTFENIKWIQNSTDALALHVVEMGGEGTVYKNCSFVFGVSDNLDQTNAYEVVCGEDSGTFIKCQFGSDTLDSSVARAVMVFDIVTTSQEMKSCVFEECIWNIASDDANANFIRVLATTDVKFGTVFIRCIFHCTLNQTFGAVKLTDAVDSVASLVEGSLFFVDCHCNCTNFSSALTANLSISSTASDAATSGVAVTPS